MFFYIKWLSNGIFTFDECKKISPEIVFEPDTMADDKDASGFVYVGF
jgi:hypothetical protein